MNIGIMQLSSNMSINSKPISRNQSAATSEHSPKKTNSFEEIFNKVMSSKSNNEISATKKETNEPIDVESLGNLLGAQSLEEVVDLLGIPHDGGLLTLQAGEEGKALAFDEMMDMENLLSVLGIEPAQLLETIQQLSGAKADNSGDIWQVINSVVGQETELVQQLVSALEGEQKVTSKEAEQLLQFLKLAQVTGKNTDLFANQAQAMEELNNMLKSAAKEISTLGNNQPIQLPNNQSGKVSLQGFEQVVQKVMEDTETTETPETTKATVNAAPALTNITNTTRTVTITLPTEKGAQSEALAKEMQNLLNRSQISNTPGMTKLLLKLYPENLGSIRIEIMQQDGVLSARLLTSTSMGKEILDNQLHQLKTAFANANIQMDRIDIAQSLQETDRNQKDQGQFGQQFKQQSEQKEHEQDDHEDETEKLSFSDYLINEEV